MHTYTHDDTWCVRHHGDRDGEAIVVWKGTCGDSADFRTTVSHIVEIVSTHNPAGMITLPMVASDGGFATVMVVAVPVAVLAGFVADLTLAGEHGRELCRGQKGPTQEVPESGGASRRCAGCGVGFFVRIRYAAAHACPECMAKERDALFAENERLALQLERLRAANAELHHENEYLADAVMASANRADVALADVARLTVEVERLRLACDVFEKNSAGATKDWEEVRRLRGVIRRAYLGDLGDLAKEGERLAKEGERHDG